jgi:cellulose synthase operon protein C
MKKYIAILFCLSISFLFFSCASGPFDSLDKLKDQLNIKNFPEQKDYPEADALVLSEYHDANVVVGPEKNIMVTSIGGTRFVTEVTNREVKKVFKNVEKHAFEEIYLSSSEELINLNARTIKTDGTIIDLKKEDFHTIIGAGQDAAFYPDFKKIRFTYPGIEKNSIVEYEYKIRVKYPFVRDEWEVQSRLPKLQNIYRLTVPILFLKEGSDGKDDGWKFKAFNFSLKNPSIENNAAVTSSYSLNTVVCTWDERNIPAFEPDPVMGADQNYIRNVKFIPSEWETWSDVSKWFYGHFFKPQLLTSDKVTNKVKELTKDCSSEIEKMQRIYNFVQSVHYIDVELGLGGYTPHTPEEVLNQNYGDCKDKAVLLLGMLKSAGLEAKPVLVLKSDQGLIHPRFPNWNFNHMIVKASTHDKIDYWMDPTIKYCKFGSLPYQCENINVLVLNNDETSQIESTPGSNCVDNSKNLFMKLDLTNSDTSYVEVAIKCKGAFNTDYKSSLSEKTRDEMLKYCKSLVSDKYLNAEILDYSLNNLDSVNSDLTLNFKFRVPNLIEGKAGLIVLNADLFPISNNWGWLDKESRTYDIEFSYPYTLNRVIEIILPENKYTIKNLPTNSISSEQGFNYSRDVLANGNNRIVENERFSITNNKIGAQYYKTIKNYFDNVKNRLNEKIILTTK